MTKEAIMQDEYAQRIVNWGKAYKQSPSIFDAAHSAMDRFAKEQSIGFAEWLEEKYVRSRYKRLTGEVLWKRKASGKSTIEELTAENTAGELYTLYQETQSKIIQ